MKAVAYLLVGVAIGVLGTLASYRVLHRDTVVYETVHPVTAEGIVIPRGTKLIHDTAMSEGFDTLRLYINVESEAAAKHFKRTVDRRSMLVIPYWVRDPQDASPKPPPGAAAE
ncbi:MAG: hypothetical protein IAG10_33765 [Planctomycetaceae bacterium]|nr:hypothetical protein [Planctomycetaceae bacterium]